MSRAHPIQRLRDLAAALPSGRQGESARAIMLDAIAELDAHLVSTIAERDRLRDELINVNAQEIARAEREACRKAVAKLLRVIEGGARESARAYGILSTMPPTGDREAWGWYMAGKAAETGVLASEFERSIPDPFRQVAT